MSAGKTQAVEFSCVIADSKSSESFSAIVSMSKKVPVRTSLQDGRIDLADVYITPVVGNVSNKHDHFVLYDHEGNGLHIVRDAFGREVRRTTCTIWDLGTSFALQVMEHLRAFR